MKKDWNIIVKCEKGRGEEVRAILAQSLTGDEHALDGANIDFINSQEYVTGVPVEIAMTTDQRNALMEANPNCRWIVTGVAARSVERLVNDYGYEVLTLPERTECACENEPKCSVKMMLDGREVVLDEHAINNEMREAVITFFQELDKIFSRK